MSLFKQLLIAICVLMLVNFSGSFLVSLESSRGQQVAQLRAHAQDAATALGLSLSPHVGDVATVELMISSIFDSGYFQSIRVIDLESDKVLAERSGAPVSPIAPDWFARLVDLEPASGDAIVSDGWRQAARVEVVSHPLFAIGRLWQSALGMLLWLALSSVLCICLGVLLIKRQLRPLDYLVEQATAISRREFLSVPKMPRTPEFRRVVNAMNQMVEKLKALFAEEAARSEKLREEAYYDSLTGLFNRRYFDLQLQARLSGENASSGYFLLIRVNDLAGLNQRFGGQHTDRILLAVAEQLKRFDRQHLLARNRGGEFAMLVFGIARDEAEQLATALDQALATLQQTGLVEHLPVAHIGLTVFTPGNEVGLLYQALDQALAQALLQSDRNWAFHEPSGAPLTVDERQTWHRLLDGALSEGRLQLYIQPVVDASQPQRVLHHKVLARLLDEQGHLLPAGRFLPWVERFGWAARLDLSMLDSVLQRLATFPGQVALSLSGSTLRDSQALAALYDKLRQFPEFGPRLVLELEENQLPGADDLQVLASRLKGLGFSMALQHFGGRFSMIGNLARLGLAYIKVDGSHIRAIDQENDKRLFIEAMQRAANSIDVPLIAERVETQGELEVLQALGIQGVKGQLFGSPEPWQ
ncbi:EAL domain-containing protein [Pseudomonas sp. LRF_L74]|uniref:EAL domain-containing protein n=1 Tax=Pseudomonas sp. LRF_L74 TaxID=3369422 RepID=UPI003F5E41D5